MKVCGQGDVPFSFFCPYGLDETVIDYSQMRTHCGTTAQGPGPRTLTPDKIPSSTRSALQGPEVGDRGLGGKDYGLRVAPINSGNIPLFLALGVDTVSLLEPHRQAEKRTRVITLSGDRASQRLGRLDVARNSPSEVEA